MHSPRRMIAVMVALACHVACAVTVSIPDPPVVPPAVAKTERGQTLTAERAALLATRDAWVRENASYAAAASQEVSDEEAAALNARRTLILKNRDAYVAAVRRFQAKLAAEKQQLTLPALRAELRQAQDALRRLQSQQDFTEQEAKHWQEVTTQSVEHAQGMLGEAVLDILLTVPGERMDALYNQMGKDVAANLTRARELLNNASEEGQREQLRVAIRMLSEEGQAISRIHKLVTGLNVARTGKAVDDLAQSEDRTALRDNFVQLLSTSANAEVRDRMAREFGLGFQTVTTMTDVLGQYRAADKMIKALYDVTAVSLAWQQIRVQNDTAERTLKAIDVLSHHVEGLVTDINELKTTEE